ncbi:MAG: hypothetical protein ACHWZW_08210 [Spirulina sp.]
MPADQAQACLDQLRQQGYPAAAMIGEARPLESERGSPRPCHNR